MEGNVLAGKGRGGSVPHDRRRLSEMCKEFLAQERTRNTMTIREFEEYADLFRTDFVKNASASKVQELSYKYSRRTNMRVPVTIVDPEVIDDENGSLYAEMDSDENVRIINVGHKYKIIAVLPSWMPDLTTMDAGGPKAVNLAVECMVNTRTKASPFDTRGEEYAKQFERVFLYLNQKKLKEHEEEVATLTEHLFSKEDDPEQQSTLSTPTKEEEVEEPAPMTGVVWDD